MVKEKEEIKETKIEERKVNANPIEGWSEERLKSMAYDIVIAINNLQRDLNILNMEIEKRKRR